MGGILASANLDALTKEGFWKNLHVAIMLLTLGGVACVLPAVWEYCVGGQLLIIATVWKLKLVLPPQAGKPTEKTGIQQDAPTK
jgi:hypothetical protein